MKIITQKVCLFICVFVGLSSFSIGSTYCTLENNIYKESNKAGTSSLCDQAEEKDGSLSPKKTKPSKQPNILLIGIETLRADHVGCLGYFRNTTPTLDKLAKEGVVFSRAIATSSWTMPTIMSTFTSLYPGIHKTTDYQKKLPAGRTTLAEILKENGYLTAAFVSSPTLDNRYGFSKGFDLYDDFSVRLDIGLDLFGNNDVTNYRIHDAITSEAVNRAAIGWLQKNHQKPFFMFVFYFDPHYDYVPSPPFDTVFDPDYEGSIDGRGIDGESRKSTRPPQRELDHIVALYDGEILYTDGCISRLLEKFTEYGILDETLVIVFGDHGDEFYEHGSTTHGHSLYNELIHIPLILRWPSAVPGNRQISDLVTQVDIMPTILDYLDIEYDGLIQGSSLRPLIEGQKDKLHDVVYAELSSRKNRIFAAAVSEDNKFILDLKAGKKRLFDLSNDPHEQINIYKEQSSVRSVPLEHHLILWLSNNDRLAEQFFDDEDLQKVELDDNLLRELKTLGYIQ